jgi:GT2 family glycosyltransferase
MGSDKNRIGVVTVTYNSAAVIDEFMTAMLDQTHKNFILYIVDNASADNTLKKLDRYDDPRIVILPNDLNVGVAAGNNQGIQASLQACCDHVLMLNNDTVFEAALLEKLLAGLDAFHCDLIVPKMMYFDDKSKIWYAGGQLIRWKAYSARHVGMNEIDTGKYDRAVPDTYAPTCCLLVKREVIEKIGLMDEKYFVYCDDTDFCYRAMKSGYLMYYRPDVGFYHKVSSLTGGDDSEFAIRYMVRNKVYYMRKQKKRIVYVAIILFCLKTVFDQIFRNRKGFNIHRIQLIYRSIIEGMFL